MRGEPPQHPAIGPRFSTANLRIARDSTTAFHFSVNRESCGHRGTRGEAATHRSSYPGQTRIALAILQVARCPGGAPTDRDPLASRGLAAVVAAVVAPEVSTRPTACPKARTGSDPPHGERRAPVPLTTASDPQPLLNAPVHELPSMTVHPVNTPAPARLWNEYITRYHYLGHTPLSGSQMRYEIFSGDLRVALIVSARKSASGG